MELSEFQIEYITEFILMFGVKGMYDSVDVRDDAFGRKYWRSLDQSQRDQISAIAPRNGFYISDEAMRAYRRLHAPNTTTD